MPVVACVLVCYQYDWKMEHFGPLVRRVKWNACVCTL